MEENDKEIQKRFDALSVDEKNLVLEMLWNKGASKWNSHKNEEKFFSQVMQLVKDSNKSLIDLSDDELNQYIQTASLFYPCSYRYFSSWNNFAQPSSWSFWYQGWLTSPVSTDPNGEIACDYEIWYNVSRSRVWWTTWRARFLVGFNGGVYKRTVNGKDSILVWGRAFGLYGTSTFDMLHQEIVIW